MAMFNTYEAILQEVEESEALEYARGFVWSECETTEQQIARARHVDDIDGIEVWYDYGADYYFFCPVTNED